MTTVRRVLITGAGGFVGGALARGFAALGWDVVGVDRSFDEPEPNSSIRQISCELGDQVPDELRSLGALDLLIHGAWITTDPGRLGMSEADYRGLNLGPARGALELARDTAVSAFVFLSSSGVFQAGDASDGAGLTDADRPTGTSAYGRVKREAEDLVLRTCVDEATEGHVVRLGYLYGPREAARESRQGVSLVAQWIAQAGAGAPLEVRADDPRREWTYAPDLARALEHVVEAPPAARPLHLGSPHVHHDSEMAKLIIAAAGGGELVEIPAGRAVKSPMVPSDVPELRDFEWTAVRTGLARVLGRAASASETPDPTAGATSDAATGVLAP